MPGWEYMKIDLGDAPPKGSDVDLLLSAGLEGWELVSLSCNNGAYLKRPIGWRETASEPPAGRRAKPPK